MLPAIPALCHRVSFHPSFIHFHSYPPSFFSLLHSPPSLLSIIHRLSFIIPNFAAKKRTQKKRKWKRKCLVSYTMYKFVFTPSVCAELYFRPRRSAAQQPFKMEALIRPLPSQCLRPIIPPLILSSIVTTRHTSLFMPRRNRTGTYPLFDVHQCTNPLSSKGV
jgi:hypothetical protein